MSKLLTIRREEFKSAIREVLDKLKDERVRFVASTPIAANSMDEAVSILEDYLADCDGIPRIGVIGMTGVGKSTLINHMFEAEVASVDPTHSETKEMKVYAYPPPNGDCFEICDTRGLGEAGKSAEALKQLEDDLLGNRPHLLVYAVDAGRRDAIDHELIVLKSICDKCKKKFFRVPSLMFVMTRSDTLTPAGFDKLPELPLEGNSFLEPQTVELKRKNLILRMNWFREQLERNGFDTNHAIAPCALEWGETSRKNWNLNGLLEVLHTQSSPALLMGFGDSDYLAKRLESLAWEVVFRFTTLATIIAASSLPLSDIAILVPLQYSMLRIISAFGNKGNLRPVALLELVGLSGQGGKWAASTLAKFFPGGNAINAAIAGSFTCGLGYIAIDHYIHGKYPDLKVLNILELGQQFSKRSRK